MAEENPFAKYVRPEENPFAKYARPAAQPDAVPPQDPTEQMFVSREAIDPQAKRVENLPKYYGEMIPMAADAATFGLGNRGIAYGRSVLDGSGGGNYSSHIAQQNEYLKQLRDADPDRAVLSELIGGVGSGAGMAKAGFTLAKPTAGWISRAIRGGTEGALQGAAQGAGQSYGTLGEKAAAAGSGAVLGGVFGTGIPLAVSFPHGVRTLADIYKHNIPEFPPQLLRGAEQDRKLVETLTERLGPEAALVDTPQMRRIAAGSMASPGHGASKMEDMLTAREEATTPRLREGTREFFGPDVSPRQVKAEIKASLKEEGPEWNAAFQNAKAVDTTGVANWIDAQTVLRRGDAVTELEKVRKALNVKGTDQLDPDPRTLHQTRRMIDGLLSKKDIDSNVLDALKGAREMISKELHTKVSGMAILDAAWAEKASRLKAFERGQEIFDTSRKGYVTPEEWRAERAAMELPKNNPRSVMTGASEAPDYSTKGTRAELGRVVEGGSDDLRTLRKQFGPYKAATEKLADQFGVKNVEQFQHLIDTNQTFRAAFTDVLKGSQTFNKMEAAKDALRGYFNTPKFTPAGVLEFAGDQLAEQQAGYAAGVRNRITDVLSTRGDAPTFEQLRKDLLSAAAEQARRDLSRTIVEHGARLGVTTEAPRATRR